MNIRTTSSTFYRLLLRKREQSTIADVYAALAEEAPGNGKLVFVLSWDGKALPRPGAELGETLTLAEIGISKPGLELFAKVSGCVEKKGS